MTADDLTFEACPFPGRITIWNGCAIRLGTAVVGVWTDIDTAQRICDLLEFFGVNDLADLASIEGET